MKFPRCIQLDGSDKRIFHRSAEPGEWAVTGSFAFADCQPEALDRKGKIAFHSGWLGTESFGHSTLVEVAEISEAEFFQVVEKLARHFVEAYGAPDLASALPAARAEADDAAQLCDHKTNTLLTLEREITSDGLMERVRVVQKDRATEHAKIWQISKENTEEPDGK